MNYVYVIMDDTHKSERPRRPELGADDYCIKYVLGAEGVKRLWNKCRTDEEREYIGQNAARLEKMDWAFNMVYLMKQACGHFEIFQNFVQSEDDAMHWLGLMAEESKTRKCTRCICNWKAR